MFINLKNGEIKFDDEYILNSKLSINEFKKSKYYENQNEDMIIDIDGLQRIDGILFYVSLIFEEGYLNKIFLTLKDKSINSFEDEPKRKILHDGLLKSMGIEEKGEFSWGRIISNYDRKGGGSDIIITYN